MFFVALRVSPPSPEGRTARLMMSICDPIGQLGSRLILNWHKKLDFRFLLVVSKPIKTSRLRNGSHYTREVQENARSNFPATLTLKHTSHGGWAGVVHRDEDINDLWSPINNDCLISDQSRFSRVCCFFSGRCFLCNSNRAAFFCLISIANFYCLSMSNFGLRPCKGRSTRCFPLDVVTRLPCEWELSEGIFFRRFAYLHHHRTLSYALLHLCSTKSLARVLVKNFACDSKPFGVSCEPGTNVLKFLI